MSVEHWLCPGCGEIDGPRAGMTCHGPQMTGGCASVRNEVVEISHDAALRLEGAVSLSGEQWERVLWWLHKPLPPGPAKALDESIIRAINAQRGQ